MLFKERREQLGCDTYQDSPLNEFVNRLTGGRLGVETDIVYFDWPYISDESLQKLYPLVGTKVKIRIVKPSKV